MFQSRLQAISNAGQSANFPLDLVGALRGAMLDALLEGAHLILYVFDILHYLFRALINLFFEAVLDLVDDVPGEWVVVVVGGAAP